MTQFISWRQSLQKPVSPDLIPEMLKPNDPITEPKLPRKKGRTRVSDLTPQKDLRGGSTLYPKDPPLPIPPRGFITPTENGNAG